MRWATLILLVIMSGCATRYQKMGMTGGYDDFQITRNTFEISFRGNGYTRYEKVSCYILRRASELTLQHGYTHFLPLREVDHTKVDMATTASGGSTTYGGRGGVYTYGSGHSYSQSVEKPGIIMRVRCFNAPLPDDPDLIDAREYLHMNFPEDYPNALEAKESQS